MNAPLDDSPDGIGAKLRSFMAQYLENHPLTDDEDIFATGYVTSMFAMQLVTFIEKEFRLEIGPEDLQLDNFRSVSAMRSLIRRKS